MPWRDLPRLGAILWRLVPLVVSFTRDRRRWIRWGGPAVRTRAFHERRARRMVHDLAMLGPAFVKLAQIFATRADLVPEPYLAQLGTLTDQVPPVPWSQIRSALLGPLGLPLLRAQTDSPHSVLTATANLVACAIHD
jgi:predicted unusual protein kinase regulating ubiquinone biosynthesis (AarF/ABC1/UbiB family)